jgi:hypothetical protein
MDPEIEDNRLLQNVSICLHGVRTQNTTVRTITTIKTRSLGYALCLLIVMTRIDAKTVDPK